MLLQLDLKQLPYRRHISYYIVRMLGFVLQFNFIDQINKS